MKASAVLIALISGTILTAILSLTILASSQDINSILKSNDQVIAESLARNGIEEGLLRYRIASLGFNLEKVYLLPSTDQKSPSSFAIKMDALSFGGDYGASDWLDQADFAQSQGALPVKSSDELNIDLNYLYKFASEKERPTNIEIKFSNPFVLQGGQLEKASSYSTISYELIDSTQNNKVISKGQARSNDSHQISVSGLSVCISPDTSCKLKITSGSLDKSARAFMKIQAKSSSGIIEPKQDKPGTVVIDAIGNYSRAKVELTAKFDTLGGKYLGIFNPVVK